MNEAQPPELVGVTLYGTGCRDRLQQEVLSKGTAPEAVSGDTKWGQREMGAQRHSNFHGSDSMTMVYLMNTGWLAGPNYPFLLVSINGSVIVSVSHRIH